MQVFLQRLFFVLLTSLVAQSHLAWAEEAPSEPNEKVVIQLKWLHQFQFAGYYAALSQGYFKDEGLEVELRPRSGEQTPEESQTGPARRGDITTIEKHLSLIEDAELHQLYKTFTNHILTKFNHEKL